MAGIKQPLQDVLTKLAAINAINQDNIESPLYTRIWNNQFKQLEEGEIYNFPLPAAFVEVISPSNYTRIGIGFSDADIILRVHLGHEYLNGEGTFEQDLIIFDLRDSVIEELSDYQPTACSNLILIAESQNYEHTNLYVYEIDFTCSFIDSKGSKYDTGRVDIYIEKEPPTILQLNVTK